MKNNFQTMQALLREKAEFQARLNLIPYDGTVEIKTVSEKKYLYIRKRIVGKVTSSYVGPYSDDLYQVLLKGVKDAKDLRKSIRKIEKELAKVYKEAMKLVTQKQETLSKIRAGQSPLPWKCC